MAGAAAPGRMFHPATLLVLWAGFAVALQTLAWLFLLVAAGVTFIVGLMCAQQRLRRLFWRSRWLFLSLAILFLFFTPGEYLPNMLGRAGMTREGSELAVSHISLLSAMLASLAVLHECIGTRGLLAGLYGLLRPLGMSRTSIVRMMLVLDIVETPPAGGWRVWLAMETESEGRVTSLTLEVPDFNLTDRVLIMLVSLGGLSWVVLR